MAGFTYSAEWHIDSQLEGLAQKILRGEATDAEKKAFHELANQRAQLMRTNDRANIAKVRAHLRQAY